MSARAFGEQLIAQLRDPAVADMDRLLSGRYGGIQAAAWREACTEPSVREQLERLGPDIVDVVIFRLLELVDEGALDVAFPRAGVATSDDHRGEYGGWFEGADGWRHWFARERFNDYYAEDNGA